MKICFLIHERTPLLQAVNAYILANACCTLGYETSFAFTDSLACYDGKVRARMARLKGPFAEHMSFDEMPFADGSLASFDILWILSFGTRNTFSDRMQLLKLLPPSVRIVNSLDSLLFMHSKISHLHLDGLMQCPETHISSDAEALWTIVDKSNAEWVIKPVAESLGRSVFKLVRGDTNIKPLLQAMTGEDGSRYCLLQRYLPEVTKGEKRVLVAGGEVIGQYFRKPTAGDHRGNLHQGGQPTLCDLTAEERAGCQRVAGYLLEQGVYFAGLDISWPWLIEWNVVNPGGIATIEKLGGENLAKTVVQKVLNAAAGHKAEAPAGKRPKKSAAS